VTDAAIDNGVTTLHVAALKAHEAISRALIAAGANVDAARDDCTAPLFIAVQSGREGGGGTRGGWDGCGGGKAAGGRRRLVEATLDLLSAQSVPPSPDPHTTKPGHPYVLSLGD